MCLPFGLTKLLDDSSHETICTITDLYALKIFPCVPAADQDTTISVAVMAVPRVSVT